MRTLHLTLAAALLAPSLLAQTPTQTTFTHLGTVNIFSTSAAANPEFIGTNPAAIAWNGSRCWVAGFCNTGTAQPSAIIEILNPLSGAHSYGTRFAQTAPTGLRGYSGLDIQGDTLVAALDLGAAVANGISAWDVSASGAATNLWNQTARGASGVSFDPGVGGVDAGVGWTSFNFARRALNATAGGAVLYDTTTGFVFQATGTTGTLWRDTEFDPDTGDIYLRRENDVIFAPRTGPNASSGGTVIVTLPESGGAGFTAGQNIAYINTPYGDRLIFNNRPDGSNVQDFFQRVMVTTPAGVSHTVNWGSFTPVGLSTAWFDFSWDAPSGTLAVLDFGNRAIYFFRLEPPTESFAYCTAGTSTNGCNAQITAAGYASATQASPFTLTINNVEGQKSGIVFYSLAGPSAQSWGAGNTSFLCVKAPTQRTSSQTSGGTLASCNGSFTLDWNAWLSGSGLSYPVGTPIWVQSWYRDPPAPKTTNLSDGLQFFISP